MKSICFYFQIHQPFRLKRYRFFDIGNDHYYYDDFNNEEIITRVAERSYMPMVNTLLSMIKESNGSFKCALSITGTAIEQLQQYVPEFIDLLKKLSETGCVEFLSETYSHSLASIECPEEFSKQVRSHDLLIKNLFGKTPKVFRNTELIYDDDIASMLSGMGIKGALIEGAKHVLGWKSPNYVFKSAVAPQLKLLLKNDKLTNDIDRNFVRTDWDEYPLTAEKYIDWISSLPQEQQIVNIFMGMETFGEFIPADTGIFEFLKALPRYAKEKGIDFVTPAEAFDKFSPVGEISVPYPMSWSEDIPDVSSWKGNRLQNEALNKLYSLAERVDLCEDRRIKQDWNYLQSSDHFYYMNTRHLGDGGKYSLFSPYDSPYSAFTNYMNILSDFIVRVEEQYPLSIENEELNSLLLTIRNQSSEIAELNKEVKQLRANMRNNKEDNQM